MTINTAAIKEKLDKAKAELLAAEEALEHAIADLQTRERSKKEIIGGQLESAFSRLRVARTILVGLEEIILEGEK